MNAKNVAEILDVLAAKFGTTATHLWDVLIRQVYVSAITDMMLGALLTISAVLLSRWSISAWEKQKGYTDDKEMVLSVAAVIVSIGAFVVDIATIYSVAALANPEYAALKLILEAIASK